MGTTYARPGTASQPLGAAQGLLLAGALAGMELSYLSALTADEQHLRAVGSSAGAAPWPPLLAGGRIPRQDSMCARMLDGAAPRTADAAHDPAYAACPLRQQAGIASYVGVPLYGLDGSVLGTLCSVDRSAVDVGDRAMDALTALAPLLAHELVDHAERGVSLTRAGSGWHVQGSATTDRTDDLTTAMVLADLLAEDLGGPPARPARGTADDDEVDRLKVSVAQLEHALAARVVVEQAIGVLAERRRLTPRGAFELLRGTARGTGRRVHSLAGEVVASTTGQGSGLAAAMTRSGAAPSPAAVASAVRPQPPRPGREAGQPAGS